jgi:glutaconate CoA-transferase subunit A
LNKVKTLNAAIKEFIHDGDAIALEGFTHLIPFAAGHEIIRQGLKNLTLIRMTPDLIYDQLIGAGCASKIIFSWGGNPGVGSLYRLRDAIENSWPLPLEIDEQSHAGMANAYVAGASRLPFAVLRGYEDNDLVNKNPHVKSVDCPFTNETLAAIPALRPNVTVVHAQQADREGNVLIYGIVGIQKEAVMAADKVIVTVEEVVDEFTKVNGSVILPSLVVDAIVEAPHGAFPSYAHGYYARSNDYYKKWNEIAKSREGFEAWLKDLKAGKDV